ncbi:MAG: hypothetical protein ACOCP1_00835 [Campylobacterales bacterium]
MEDKDQLLEDLKPEKEELSVRILLFVFAFMLLMNFLFIPKIYLRNQIYYSSKNIDNLQIQRDSLLEENKALEKKLEDIKFKFLTTEIPIDLEMPPAP